MISLCVGHTFLSIALMDLMHPACAFVGSFYGHFIARVVEISYFYFSIKAIFFQHNFLDVDMSFHPAADFWQGKGKSEAKECCF